jgi:methionyl-tRNA synthetase
VIQPLDLIDVYGADALRFYLIRAATFGQDGNASIEGVHERYERELANDLGNLVSRTTALIARYRDGSVSHIEVESRLTPVIERVAQEVPALIDRWELTPALEVVWDLVRALNRHVEQTKPWELAKDDGAAAELDRVLYELGDGLRAAAVALWAYVPETAERVLAALGEAPDIDWDNVAAGRTASLAGIEAASPLFPRVDSPAAAA